MTAVMSFHIRQRQEMGLKLSTSFLLPGSFKHKIVLPKVSHSGNSSVFPIQKVSNSPMKASQLFQPESLHSVPTRSFPICHLSTPGSYHISCYLQLVQLVIPSVIADVTQPFRTSIVLITHTPNATPKRFCFSLHRR